MVAQQTGFMKAIPHDKIMDIKISQDYLENYVLAVDRSSARCGRPPAVTTSLPPSSIAYSPNIKPLTN